MNWMQDGGNVTVGQFVNLSREDRDAVLEFFEEFVLYEVISVKDRKYVLVHADL